MNRCAENNQSRAGELESLGREYPPGRATSLRNDSISCFNMSRERTELAQGTETSQWKFADSRL